MSEQIKNQLDKSEKEAKCKPTKHKYMTAYFCVLVQALK